MKNRIITYSKWLLPGLSIKRWLILLLAGVLCLGIGIAEIITILSSNHLLPEVSSDSPLYVIPAFVRIPVILGAGIALLAIGLYELNRSILEPYTAGRDKSIVDVIYSHQQRKRGPHIVALGGGTGLPSVLRGMKQITNNITAIVTVADNGGSSGRLRRDMGILPPGDLRNNIAALADDEDLMTQLFQYRFSSGDLDGHSFGNLFLTALSDITGSMEHALLETEQVLAVRGSVLPATLDDVTLKGEVWHPVDNVLRTVTGESEIAEVGGKIERVYLEPLQSRAYPKSVQALLSADIIVIGPGSLYTSILPSLLINGITDAIRASHALCVYVCNVATQPGETDAFNVGDHIRALEAHLGVGVFQTVVANNHFPTENAGQTQYVMPAKLRGDITERYDIIYADLTDLQHPWRHDPVKLARALQTCYANNQSASLQDAS